MSELVERLRNAARWDNKFGNQPDSDHICWMAADRIESLEREVEELRKDAERLDWIQRQDFDDLYFIIFQDQPNDGKYGVSQGCIGKGWAVGDTFRAAIDAAMKDQHHEQD